MPSEFFVIKRELCGFCEGDGVEKRRSLTPLDTTIKCHECEGKGHIETQVNLLDALDALRGRY